MYGKDDKKLRTELKHECELPPEHDLVVTYIKTGCFVECRRRFRRMMILSGDNQLCKVILKSSNMVREEKQRHLKMYYYIIHPFSPFRENWETFLMCELIFMSIGLSFSCILPKNINSIMTGVADCFNVVDILLHFNTGYHDYNYHYVIMKRKQIVRHYLTGLFIYDLLSTMDIFHYLLDFGEDGKALQYMLFLQLFRIPTMFKYIDRCRDYKQYSIYKFKIFKVVVTLLLVINWCWCIIVLSEKVEGENTFQRKYLSTCYAKAIYLLLLYGGPNPTHDVIIILVEVFCLMVGFMIQILIVSQILQVITKYSSISNKYYQMTQQVEEYIRYKCLPSHIKNRILSYVDFRFQQNYYKEGEIMCLLSMHLKKEMLAHNYLHLLEKVNIFEDLPVTILTRFIVNMIPEIYLPSDVIVTAGAIGDCMFLIASGTVAVYTPTGREICHLTDGANFGEISLIMENENRAATVVAIDCCELFILGRKEFMGELEKYPEVYTRIRNMAKERMKKTMLASMNVQDEELISDWEERDTRGASFRSNYN